MNLSVNLDFGQLLEVVKQLSPKEKIKLSESIWEDNIEIPQEHQKLVRDRIKKKKTDPKGMLDWDNAVKTLTS